MRRSKDVQSGLSFSPAPVRTRPAHCPECGKGSAAGSDAGPVSGLILYTGNTTAEALVAPTGPKGTDIQVSVFFLLIFFKIFFKLNVLG